MSDKDPTKDPKNIRSNQLTRDFTNIPRNDGNQQGQGKGKEKKKK